MGHFIEAAGVPTAGISLIREHSAGIRPPRALWVPFPLGRPFGAPNNQDFQTSVLSTLLALFEQDIGPVILQDYLDNAPSTSWSGTFTTRDLPPRQSTQDPLAAARVEIDLLTPLHAEAMAGPDARTITGASGLTPVEIHKFLGDFLHGREADLPSTAATNELPELLRLAVEEMRHWCIESAMAEPGGDLSADAIDNWFWGETAMSALILAVREKAAANPDEKVQLVANRALVPAAQQHRVV